MDKHIPSVKRLQQEASLREAAAAKRMHELMRQFGTIFRQVVANTCSSLLFFLSWSLHPKKKDMPVDLTFQLFVFFTLDI